MQRLSVLIREVDDPRRVGPCYVRCSIRPLRMRQETARRSSRRLMWTDDELVFDIRSTDGLYLEMNYMREDDTVVGTLVVPLEILEEGVSHEFSERMMVNGPAINFFLHLSRVTEQ